MELNLGEPDNNLHREDQPNSSQIDAINAVSCTSSNDVSRVGPVEQSEARKVRKELHWLEVLNFCGQIILAVVGIIAAVIYGKQLGVMQKQLQQIEDSSHQTDRLLNLYQQQLAQLTNQASDMHVLAQQAQTQAVATQDQASTSKIIALASNRQAEASARSADAAKQSVQTAN